MVPARLVDDDAGSSRSASARLPATPVEPVRGVPRPRSQLELAGPAVRASSLDGPMSAG